ncbi:MAG TPA: hypothetical protein VMI52_01310 [Acetobacteraceae bacterium]|nr:hypothetical protein [Acetobacteraceae bacterium]
MAETRLLEGSAAAGQSPQGTAAQDVADARQGLQQWLVSPPPARRPTAP